MASEKNRRAAHAAGHMGASPRRRRPAAPEVSQEDRITTIRSGQGATATTRKNAAQAARRARRNAEQRYYERHPEARSAAGGTWFFSSCSPSWRSRPSSLWGAA